MKHHGFHSVKGNEERHGRRHIEDAEKALKSFEKADELTCHTASAHPGHCVLHVRRGIEEDVGKDDLDDAISKKLHVSGAVRAPRRACNRNDTVDVEPRPPTARLHRSELYVGRGGLIQVNGKSATLTAKEFDLLHYLASHPEQVFSREQLMNDVWDYTFAGDASTVTVHKRRLREKIEPDSLRPRYVKTVWGVGYKFER